MEQYSIELTPQMMIIVPVVAGIIQVLKQVEIVNRIKDWMPLVSIALSFGLAYLMKVPDPVLPSIVCGLVASGAYDLLKAKK